MLRGPGKVRSSTVPRGDVIIVGMLQMLMIVVGLVLAASQETSLTGEWSAVVTAPWASRDGAGTVLTPSGRLRCQRDRDEAHANAVARQGDGAPAVRLP